jgi:hypothetical protein
VKITEKHERILIVLVALHSVIIGVVFFLAPDWLIRFGGWQRIEPIFFAHQAGAFHLALATAYLIEYFRYRGILVILGAKSIALIFLMLEAFLGTVPWAVPVSGLGDGAMAVLVWWVHRRVGSPHH